MLSMTAKNIQQSGDKFKFDESKLRSHVRSNY